MNLLLVDDEEYVIESIRKNVDWEKSGITRVCTAFSMKQAQAAMEPTTNCPSAPILNTPVRREKATLNPVKINGLA